MHDDVREVRVPLIIPAYEPDERFMDVLKSVKNGYPDDVIIVNDGSSSEYNFYFDIAREYDYVVLDHYRNMGKGRALKTAFNYCLNEYSEMIGCITADSDGQHTLEDILRCREKLLAENSKLILGCRNFEGDHIPVKSRLGNKITRIICRYLVGISVSDTQTGLRGIPQEFMSELLNVSGERFEFETRMLVESKDKWSISEVPINTIYDSADNHSTHFNPVKDSIRIYKIFGGLFIKYTLSSLSSCVVDLAIFHLIVSALRGNLNGYIFISTAIARIISASYDFLIKRRVVFKSDEKRSRSILKYISLCVIQMICSAALTNLGYKLLPGPEVAVKAVVDTLLFLISYWIQRNLIFKKGIQG